MVDGNCCFLPKTRLTVLAGMFSCLFFTPCSAQTWRPNSAEQSLLTEVRMRVRQCQLKNGAITRHSYGETDIPAEVDPWTGNRVVLGVLTETQHFPDLRINLLCLDWLKWCTQQQVEATGYFRRLRGTVAADLEFENTTYFRCENDATAVASYLLLAERLGIVMAGRRTEKQSAKACERCLAFLQRCREDDLYWSFAPDWVPAGKSPTRNFLDNVEVYQGLAAAERFFRRNGDATRAMEASEMAASLAARFQDYWNGRDVFFHRSPDEPQDNRRWGVQSLPLDARHNLVALALFDNFPATHKTRLWSELKRHCGKEFERLIGSDDEVSVAPPVDWMCLAALRVASKTETERLYALYRLEAQSLLGRLSKHVPRAKNPHDAREWAEYAQRRQESLPSIDRIAFIAHAIHAQNRSAVNHGFPTIDARWSELPPLEVGKTDSPDGASQSVRREIRTPPKR
jgi:hypothetical protein